MPLHFAALVPSSSSIASFIGKQIKDPAIRALGIDPASKAFRKATKSFLSALQAEYQRHETLQTLLHDSIESSVSAFVNAESVQEVLATPFRDTDAFRVSDLTRLWREIPGPGTIEKLTDLPLDFDWDLVAASYLQAVRAILEETPQIREIWIANNIAEIRHGVEAMRGVPPRFSLESYRRVLIEEDLGTLKLSAIRADCSERFDDHSVALQNIYIQQKVKAAFPPRDLSRDYRRRREAENRLYGLPYEPTAEDRDEAYRRAPVQPLSEVLGDPSCNRLVILGNPGQGKSTLLQHLALDWAQGVSPSIPFLIELRRYTRDHTNPKSFLEFTETGTWSRCHVPQSELDRYLRQRKVVVMFDGLDEIFDEARRSNTVTEIINFARDYPDARVIVTTRVMGYAVGSTNPDNFQAAGFRQFTLQEFDDNEIREFVKKWYETTISDSRECADLSDQLITAIAELGAIRELAGNPLLLTMMVMLNRRKHLPSERLNLYESCAELLVDGWDAARHLGRSEYLTHGDKIEILQRIAFEMQQERAGLTGNMISEARLKGVLIPALRDLNVAGPKLAAQKIVEALAERDFMLCFTGDEQFAFVHRTFLEYFCAREYVGHLVNAGGTGELIELFRARWSDNAWHEVLRLICSMVGPDLASDLVRELLGASTQQRGWRAVFLAAECAGEIRQAGRIEALKSATRTELVQLLDFEAVGEDREIRDEVDTETVSVRKGALDRIVKFWTGEANRELLQRAAKNQYWVVRFGAVEALIKYWKDDSTRRWLVDLTAGNSGLVAQAAVHGLAAGWPDEATRAILLELLGSPDAHIPRSDLIRELSQHWPQQTTWQWLVGRGTDEADSSCAHEAICELARRWRDGRTREWLFERVTRDNRKDIRYVAARELVRNWPRENVENQLMELAGQNDDADTRDAALIGLAGMSDQHVRKFVLNRMSDVDDPEASKHLIWAFVWIWPDEKTLNLLLTYAVKAKHPSVRQTAIHQLARHWRAQSVRHFLLNPSKEVDAETRIEFLREFVRQWKDSRTMKVLAEVAAQDEDVKVRHVALEKLANLVPNKSLAS